MWQSEAGNNDPYQTILFTLNECNVALPIIFECLVYSYIFNMLTAVNVVLKTFVTV